MKKHLSKISIIMLLLIVGYGCRKDSPTLITDELASLKSFYVQNKPATTSIFKSTSPNWSNVSTVQTDGFTVYEIALNNPDRVGLMSNHSKTKDPTKFEQTRGLKLLLFVNVNGTVEKGCYMAIEASTAEELAYVHYKKAGTLSGNIIYYNLNGIMSNGIAYVSGKARHRISYLPESEVVALKGGDGSRMVQGCTMHYIETGFYYCTFTPYSEHCGWQSTGYSGFPVCDNGGGYVDNDVEQGFEGGTSNGGNDYGLNPQQFQFIADPAINLSSLLNCFTSVSSNGASYSITLSADIPVNSDPMKLVNYSGFPPSPGHAFVTLTKTNGSTSVTKSFGFYPSPQILSLTTGPVGSKMNDNGGHEFDARISMGLTEGEFQLAVTKALSKQNISYDINEYNCTNYALDVFNSVRDPNNQLEVSNWHGSSGFNYGTTPNGLYLKLAQMQSYGNDSVSMANGNAPAKSGLCN